MGKLLKEFKEFAVKGNAVDMAVAVVIGGAFGAIVTSLVNDLIMPCIGVLIGGADFANLAVTLKAAVPEVVNDAGEVITPAKDAVLFKYGQFINTIISLSEFNHFVKILKLLIVSVISRNLYINVKNSLKYTPNFTK